MDHSDQITREMEDSVALWDMLNFFIKNFPLILVSALIGAAGAWWIYASSPRQYEANALVEMAQVYEVGAGRLDSISIENPSLLVERLRRPSTYSKTVIQQCEMEDSPEGAESLSRSVSAAAPKDLPSILDLTVKSATSRTSSQCVDAVFNMIHDQQQQMVAIYHQNTQQMLTGLEDWLNETKDLIEQVNSTRGDQVVLLAWMQEAADLIGRIGEYRRILAWERPARLVTPVYTPQQPLSPGLVTMLTLGVLAGLLGGVAIAFGRVVLASLRTERPRFTN